MFNKRIFSLLLVIVLMFSLLGVPTYAAPPPSNHTINVTGSGFDGTVEVDYTLLSDQGYSSDQTLKSNTTQGFTSLENGIYTINVTSITEGYEYAIAPVSVKLVGREKTESFTITVAKSNSEEPDTEAPVITLVDGNSITWEVGYPYEEPGYTANDNVDGDLTDDVVVDTSALDTSKIGSYEVTYTVSDAAGNTTDETRTVDVIDTESPVITLLGETTINLTTEDSYAEPGFTVEDNSEEDLNGLVIIGGDEVNTTTAGTYTITYDVSDSSGNVAEQKTRTVIVSDINDTEPPVITLYGETTIELYVNDDYVEYGYEAYDAVDGDLTDLVVVNPEILDTSTVGTYTITYNVNDSSGNVAEEKTRTVIVSEEPVNNNVHYVALGDSIATGTTGISGTMYSYAYGFRDHLATIHDNLTFTNFATDGDDSSELLYKLNHDSTMISAVEKATIITLAIGANNIMDAARDDSFWSIDETIAEAGTNRFENDYPLIISRIRNLNAEAEIISMTLFNPYNYENQPTGYSGDSELHLTAEKYISRINAKISNEEGINNYHVADIHNKFKTDYGSGKMGEITYFYPKYSWWTWWYVKLTRDPHPKQAGQDIIRDMHISIYDSL